MSRFRVYLRAPRRLDESLFLELVHASKPLHEPWIYPPKDTRGFAIYLDKAASAANECFVVCRRDDDRLVGAININEIVRGPFQSGYLGYYAFEPQARQGLMTEGLALVCGEAFGSLGLHRLEANIQPRNLPSIALVKKLGFAREGYSPRYLKIGDTWRDHERWALLSEDWRRAKS